MDGEWKNIGFTDEMSIEVGGTFGISYVWKDNAERWNKDCVGSKKKQGPTVMCWGMIGYGWKGPFYVWEPETEEERKEAEIEIARLNAEMEEEAKKDNATWRASPEWAALRKQELEAARQRAAERAKKKCHKPGEVRSLGLKSLNGTSIG